MRQSKDYEIVASTIRYLDQHYREQPSLDRLAARVGLSPYHFQRVFSRWAGVSPKRFLQFLTAEHAKGILRTSAPVLEAAWASGLSGASRLHDLLVVTEAVTPGQFKAGGRGLTVRYGLCATPFGPGFLGLTERGVCHFSFCDPRVPGSAEAALGRLSTDWPEATLEEHPEDTARVGALIFGRTDNTSPRKLTLLLKGTNFQIQVWKALLRIPEGFLTAYGRLARALLQTPKAARAVGGAVAANPIAYLIPCHRVIRETGALGGYRWGPDRKQALLGWEAARASAGAERDGRPEPTLVRRLADQ